MSGIISQLAKDGITLIRPDGYAMHLFGSLQSGALDIGALCKDGSIECEILDLTDQKHESAGGALASASSTSPSATSSTSPSSENALLNARAKEGASSASSSSATTSGKSAPLKADDIASSMSDTRISMRRIDLLYALTKAPALKVAITLIPGETMAVFAPVMGKELALLPSKITKLIAKASPYSDVLIYPSKNSSQNTNSTSIDLATINSPTISATPSKTSAGMSETAKAIASKAADKSKDKGKMRLIDTSAPRALVKSPCIDGIILPNTYKLGAGSLSSVQWLVSENYKRHFSLCEELLGRGQCGSLSDATSTKDKRHGLRELKNSSFGTFKRYWDKVIVASIIQKEAGTKEEMPLVSSVVHNRLQRGMPLQMDGALNYGVYSHIKVTKERILEDKSRYNTYLFYGIPSCPVGSVSIDAIRAAFNPARSNYLYFVKIGAHKHIFTTSYKAHLRNIK